MKLSTLARLGIVLFGLPLCLIAQSVSNSHKAPNGLTFHEGLLAAMEGEAGPNCQLVEDTWKGEKLPRFTPELTPLWAQESIGSDLARRIVERDLQDGLAETVAVGIQDIGVEKTALDPRCLAEKIEGNIFQGTRLIDFHQNHGTGVATIICGEKPLGISAAARLSWVGNVGKGQSSKVQHLSLETFLKTPTKLLNISLSAGARDPDVLKSLKAIAAGGTIAVISSGNGEDTGEYIQGNIDEAPAIVVGSCTPWGTVTNASNSSPNVTICAPSDNFLLSRLEKPAAFGGTSGAAPLVTGALADVLAYLPSLTWQQAKRLLEATALPTLNRREKPRQNGAGMINHLKLVAVARRIKTKFRFEELTNKDRETLLSKEETFSFSSEELGSIPVASDTLLDPEKGCPERRRALAAIRAQFLLTGAEPAREALEHFYAAEGFQINSRYYGLLGGKILPAIDHMVSIEGLGKSAGGRNRDIEIRRSGLRALRSIAPEGPELFQKLLENLPTKKMPYPLPESKTLVNHRLAAYRKLVNRYKEASLPVREAIIDGRLPLSETPDVEIGEAVEDLGKLGTAGKALLQKALTHKNPAVVRAARAEK